MEKARCNTELYSNLRGPLNNVKPSNFWGSHQIGPSFYIWILYRVLMIFRYNERDRITIFNKLVNILEGKNKYLSLFLTTTNVYGI